MIELKVAGYCQDCGRFESDVTRKTYAKINEIDIDPCESRSKIITDTVIRCVHSNECANMYDYIMRRARK